MKKQTKVKKQSHIMNGCDAFGKEIRLNLNGDEKIRTGCGSFMTLLCMLAIIYYVALRVISFQQIRYDKFIPIT